MAKRKDFSLTEKRELLKKFDALPKSSQRQAALKLGIPQSTLCRFLKERPQIFSDASNVSLNRKRKRVGKAEDVEIALMEWVKAARMINHPISRAILGCKAEEFAHEFEIPNFSATDGWLTRWKVRHNMYGKQYGEKSDAGGLAADGCMAKVFPKLLKDYTPNQIFNMDETTLYYRALPDHTLLLKNDSHSLNKIIKARITVLLACNMIGTVKKKPFIIGKSKNPQCLRGVKNFPVDYTNNTEAQMTSSIYTDFLQKWDRELENEKIALLLKNSIVHPDIELKNINLFFLPADKKSFTQPMDQGIIKTFKIYYRKDLKMKVLDTIDNPIDKSSDSIAKKISLLDAFHMSLNAWQNITQGLIFNSFRKAGIFISANQTIKNLEAREKEQEVVEKFDEEFLNWVNIDENVPTSEEETTGTEDVTVAIQHKAEPEVVTEDEEEVNLLPPTVDEVRNALQILRRTLEQRGESNEDYNSYYNLERKIYQLINLGRTRSTLDKCFK